MDQSPIRKRRRFLITAFGAGICLVILLAAFGLRPVAVFAQQPTGSIPTVTGTPSGPMVEVFSDRKIIGVYTGPSSYLYARVGILLAGEIVPAIGRSYDDQWIQIEYPGVLGGKGWIYAPNVKITPGSSLPYVPNPPVATPATTPTLNPTIVAIYGLDLNPTHLPTFTAPAPAQYPTFAPTTRTGLSVPIGLIIIGLALVGILGAVISFLRGR